MVNRLVAVDKVVVAVAIAAVVDLVVVDVVQEEKDVVDVAKSYRS